MRQETASADTAATDAVKREDAIKLVAADRLSDEQIAARVGIDRSTLSRWKTKPAFRQRVAVLVQAARDEAMSEAIAVKAERMRDYQELRRRLWQTIMASSETYADKTSDAFGREVPAGAAFGLMSKQIVPGSKGLLVEWVVDTAVIAELRNLNKQAAQEMGEWTERRELTGKDGGPLSVAVRPDLKEITDEELATIRAVLIRASTPPALESPGGGDGV